MAVEKKLTLLSPIVVSQHLFIACVSHVFSSDDSAHFELIPVDAAVNYEPYVFLCIPELVRWLWPTNWDIVNK
jgi:hypothetical protein